jgi:hypothetical protein
MSSDGSIALLIAGQEPPSWLSAAVAKVRATLAWTTRKESEYPSRKAMRARLEKLAAAIDMVRGEMVDFDVAMLLRAGDNFLPHENETYHGLGDLAQRVRKTLDAVAQRKGSDKYFWQSEGATPQQNCALMIRSFGRRFIPRRRRTQMRTRRKRAPRYGRRQGGR